MSRKIGRLKTPRIIDVALGADVKPDILKDLLQVDVPDIQKSVDGACKAMETLTICGASSADRGIILHAHDVYEAAMDWCNTKQLHLDVKQQPREFKGTQE